MDATTTAKSSRPSLVNVVALVAAVGVVLFLASRPAQNLAFTASGDPVPVPLSGSAEPVSLAEFEGILVGLRGTPVIVNVWASWCAPCRTETPLLQRAWVEHGDEVVILGVASKDRADLAEVFIDEFGVSYPNVFDKTGDIRQRLALRGFPTTYVFDASGALVTSIVGGLTEQRLASVIEDVTS